MTAAEPSADTILPRSITAKVRARILERDGFKCRRCGKGPGDGPLEVDHVVAVSDGGSADESNLQTLCRTCNRGKGTDAPSAVDHGPRDDVSRDALAGIIGVDVRSVTNYVTEGMPKAARGRFVLSDCVKWYVERERERARGGKGLNDLDLARQRKTNAEARIAEIDLAEKEKLVLPASVYEDELRTRCESIAGAVKAIGRYQPDVKAALTDEQADALLDRMADEILSELSGLKDEIE